MAWLKVGVTPLAKSLPAAHSPTVTAKFRWAPDLYAV